MPWDVLKSSLPYLAVLLYILIKGVLVVLTTHYNKTVSLHDRVREARLIRLKYLQALEERQAS